MKLKAKNKKSRFKFCQKPIVTLWHDPESGNVVRKQVEGYVLGDWAYHAGIHESAGVFCILHVPSGCLIRRVQKEKEASLLCKRLHTKGKNKWNPTIEESIHFALFHKETKENLKKYASKRTKFVFAVNNDYIEQFDQDIPF